MVFIFHVGDFIAYQSLSNIKVDTLHRPIPLICLVIQHECATYQWTKLGTNLSFPSTPAIHINEIGLYQCHVTCGDMNMDSMVMSVEVNPCMQEYSLLTDMSMYVYRFVTFFDMS